MHVVGQYDVLCTLQSLVHPDQPEANVAYHASDRHSKSKLSIDGYAGT